MSQFHTHYNPADKALLEVREIGGTDYALVSGVSDWSSGGGDPETTDIRDLQEIDRAVGPHTPENIAFTLSSWQFSEAYDLLRDALVGDSLLEFRLRQPNELVHTGASARTGITLQFTQSTAVLTPAPTTLVGHPTTGAGSKIGVGSAIKWTGDETSGVQNYRIIKTVAANGQITGVTFNNPPAADIAAATYAVVQAPWYKGPFNARVGSLPESGTPSGAVAGSVSLVITGTLPKTVHGIPS